MRKFLAFILLAASPLMVESSSALCFAAEDANQRAALPEAVSQQPSQRKKHQPSQRKMRRIQKTGSGTLQDNSAAVKIQGQPEEASKPSQRSMRQKLKEAKPKTPATDTPEAR